MIHSAEGKWTIPRGANFQVPFESRVVDGQRIPSGVSWTPDERRPMTLADAELKLRAIHAYTLEMKLEENYIVSFVKSEEVFWKIKT